MDMYVGEEGRAEPTRCGGGSAHAVGFGGARCEKRGDARCATSRVAREVGMSSWGCRVGLVWWWCRGGGGVGWGGWGWVCRPDGVPCAPKGGWMCPPKVHVELVGVFRPGVASGWWSSVLGEAKEGAWWRGVLRSVGEGSQGVGMEEWCARFRGCCPHTR